MKVAVLLFALLAGATALPSQPIPDKQTLTAAFRNAVDTKDTRIIDGIIINLIESLAQRIRDADLDPLYIEYEKASYDVVDDFTLLAEAEAFAMRGLSDIGINRVSFNLFTFLLEFDISLRRISFSADTFRAGVDIDGYGFYGAAVNGDIAIVEPRIVGAARVVLVPSITIRDVSLSFRLGGIESALTANLFTAEYSDALNDLLNNRLTSAINENTDAIDYWLTTIVAFIISAIL